MYVTLQTSLFLVQIAGQFARLHHSREFFLLVLDPPFPESLRDLARRNGWLPPIALVVPAPTIAAALAYLFVFFPFQ